MGEEHLQQQFRGQEKFCAWDKESSVTGVDQTCELLKMMRSELDQGPDHGDIL